MSLHVAPTLFENPELLVEWRSRYSRFATLVDEGAHPAKVLRCLGLALWQDSYLDNAARILVAATQVAPNDPMIFAELGSVLAALGRPAESLEALTASLTLDQAQPLVWLNVAALCTADGNQDMAEQAFRAALDFDPASVDAATGLGLLYMQTRRFEEAAVLLQAAIAQGATTMAIQACLGQSLFALGRFAEAGEAFGAAVAACPDEERILRKYAMARFLETAIAAPVDAALDLYRSLTGRHGEHDDIVLRTGFQLLSAYGPHAAAIRLGEALLAREPGDPVTAYHLTALRGGSRLSTAPATYVAACFDSYAANFDRHLTDVLQYSLPEHLPGLLAPLARRFERILDLGCGTGLAAPALVGFAAELTGVDLSPGMLAKAAERGDYRTLVVAEAVDFLTRETGSFDLIVALDVLVYFGDLEALMEAVAARLAPGGCFAFSVERGEGTDFVMRPCGRFAHDRAYLERLAARHFTTVATHDVDVRLEANRPVRGQMMLLQRN